VPKARLTQIGLQNLQPPAKGQIDVWDATLPSFGVRISQGGSKTFILKLDNSRRAIGRYPHPGPFGGPYRGQTAISRKDSGKNPTTIHNFPAGSGPVRFRERARSETQNSG
jgi:hypothetical protein